MRTEEPRPATGGRAGAGPALRVDMERLRADVLALAEIGRDPDDRGIYRMGFSEADMEGRRWLMDRLRDAGLEAWLDGAGNVHGLLPGAREDAGAVLIGSHTDTVPRAGMLDGALGVVAGLECLRVLAESGTPPAHPVEVISFSDEEGRFGGMFGSEAFAGRITPESLHFRALDGAVLHEEMALRGLDPLRALDARRAPETVDSYFELHIEQGPVLEAAGDAIGIVEDITGMVKWLARFRGEANHAGTTPMTMRRDAFMGLADFAHAIPRVLEEYGGENSRATVGTVQILPSAPNTVPGIVEFSLDARDTDPHVLAELMDAFRRTLSAIARRRGLMLDLEIQSEIPPVACDPGLVALVEEAVLEMGASYRRMPSGAAHDAQTVAGLGPAALILVPSRDGQSHTPREWTDWADIGTGADVLLSAVARRAGWGA